MMRWDGVGLDKQGPGNDRKILESAESGLRGGCVSLGYCTVSTVGSVTRDAGGSVPIGDCRFDGGSPQWLDG